MNSLTLFYILLLSTVTIQSYHEKCTDINLKKIEQEEKKIKNFYLKFWKKKQELKCLYQKTLK